MRRLAAISLAVSLIASNAIAAENAPLPAGKPAGVKQAALAGTPFVWVLGLAFLGAGIGLAASGNGGNTPAVTTTATATGTAP